MKSPLLVIMLFLSSLLFAEGGSSIGLKIAPLMGYRSLKSDNDYASFVNDIEKPDWGYRIGAEFKTALGDRINLYTGLNYTNSGYKIEEDITFQDENNENPSKGTMKFRFRFNSIEVPLILGYQLNESKIAISPMLGFKGAYLFKSMEYSDLKTENEKYNQSNNRSLGDMHKDFNLWGHLAIDFAYHQDTYLISFRPFFERMLTNSFKGEHVKKFYYNYGTEIVFALKL